MKKVIFFSILIIVIYTLGLIPLNSNVSAEQNLPVKQENTLVQSLFNVANNKIQDLNKTGYWSHTNSNGCDYTCRIKSVDANFSWMGENLYKGPCDIVKAMNMFEHSPEHKENLDHKFDNINVLINRQKDGSCYMAFEYGISN